MDMYWHPKEKCMSERIPDATPWKIMEEMMCDETAKIGNSIATDRDTLANNR